MERAQLRDVCSPFLHQRLLVLSRFVSAKILFLPFLVNLQSVRIRLVLIVLFIPRGFKSITTSVVIWRFQQSLFAEQGVPDFPDKPMRFFMTGVQPIWFLIDWAQEVIQPSQLGEAIRKGNR